MKKCLSICIILFLTSWRGSRETTSMLYLDRQEILKGRVERLIQTGLDPRGSPILFEYSDTLFFNKAGEQTTEKSGWSDGWHAQLDFNFSYEEGHKSLELSYPRAIGKREYEFDNDGHLVEVSYYNELGFFEKRTFSHNAAGQTIQVNVYDKKGVLLNTWQLSYEGGFISQEGLSQYKYISFDKHENWTQRVKVEKDAEDNTTAEMDTVTRKITYY